jgi:hypothetical protein
LVVEVLGAAVLATSAGVRVFDTGFFLGFAALGFLIEVRAAYTSAPRGKVGEGVGATRTGDALEDSIAT